jgi:hypothetical protein
MITHVWFKYWDQYIFHSSARISLYVGLMSDSQPGISHILSSTSIFFLVRVLVLGYSDKLQTSQDLLAHAHGPHHLWNLVDSQWNVWTYYSILSILSPIHLLFRSAFCLLVLPLVGERKQTRRRWQAHSNTSPHSCVFLIELYLIGHKITVKNFQISLTKWQVSIKLLETWDCNF